MTERTFRKSELVAWLSITEELLNDLEEEEIVHFSQEGLCSEEEAERLRVVSCLIRDLGVNVAGADVILHMRQTMIEMQCQFGAILRMIAEAMKTPHSPSP